MVRVDDGSLFSPGGRSFRCSLPTPLLDHIQAGTMRSRYRGRGLLKSPFDLVIYTQLIGSLKPSTIIEIGSKEGGSAVWFADMQAAHGITPHVISIDLVPPRSSDSRIRFIEGNACRLGDAWHGLDELPRPWLVSEDSAHTFEACSAVLEFFAPRLRRGEYIVIEDGIVADLSGAHYASFGNGPNRAVAAFLTSHGDQFRIDDALCDHFGYNVTYNPNGWLVKTS